MKRSLIILSVVLLMFAATAFAGTTPTAPNVPSDNDNPPTYQSFIPAQDVLDHTPGDGFINGQDEFEHRDPPPMGKRPWYKRAIVYLFGNLFD